MIDEELTPWRRFIRFLYLERKDIFQIFYYAIFSGILTLSLPLGIQAIINLIQGAQISTSWIILIILVVIGVAFSGLLQLMQLRIIETIQQRIFTKSSFELSYRFPKITMRELRNYYPPELANRFFDTFTLQKGLSKVLIDIPAALLQILFTLILLSFYHSFFIVFGLTLLVLIYFTFQYTAKKGLETSLQESKSKYKVAHWIQEIARSIVSFKLSGNTSLGLKKNDALVNQYLKARENHFKIVKIQFIKMITFKAIITAGLLIIGGVLVLNQQINIGQFVAAEIIILLVIVSVEKLILGLETFYDMLTAIEKLGQVVDNQLESQEGEKPAFEEGVHIELNKVSYIVPDREKSILENIYLDINPDSRILIQGKSGSGKSSLLNLISGIIPPSKGNIYINNLSIGNINLNYYRSYLGLSISEEMPFEGTLKENITFGNDSITNEKIYEIFDLIGLSQFLRELPKGLQTVLYPEGKRISFTISKKIILARAILKQPKVLILEDPLVQFDERESKSIINFLCNSTNPWSLIVVSNNPYWETKCNKTIKLEEGKINTQKP